MYKAAITVAALFGMAIEGTEIPSLIVIVVLLLLQRPRVVEVEVPSENTTTILDGMIEMDIIQRANNERYTVVLTRGGEHYLGVLRRGRTPELCYKLTPNGVEEILPA